MKTIALNGDWDLYQNTSGIIALAPRPGAIAQDVASAVRTFRDELWYNRTRGMPYLERILGRRPPAGFVVAHIKALALSIPDVKSVKVELDPLTNTRTLTGQIRITDVDGLTIDFPLPTVPWYQIAVTP